MNEVIMVPSGELNRLSNYYQGKIAESAVVYVHIWYFLIW